MKAEDVKKIAVIGSGAMGHGIAQVCAAAGFTVVMRDIKQEFLDNGMAKISEGLKFLVDKGKMKQEEMDSIMGSRLTATTDMKAAVSDAQIVIEAVPEIMDLKKSVFKEVSDLAPSDAILATNTSTMSISEIGAVVKNPERFLGMHFFNPVNRMKLVEIIYGEKTGNESADALAAVTVKLDKLPVKVLKDRPGFIVNRISAPNQALLSAILDEGKMKPDELDAGMKKMGAKMAPFETADFVGLDVFCHTLDYYAKTLSPQYKPGKFLSGKISKNELGMKSGKGIYAWKDGKAVIDTSKDSGDITPIHLLAVQVNEAVKVFKEGIAASVEDIDMAVKFGMNAFAGPFALAAGIEPKQLVDALEMLTARFGLDMLRPEPEIKDGSFKTMGKKKETGGKPAGAEQILFEQRGNIGILTINKPKANQLSNEVLEGIRRQLDFIEINREIRVLVITGSGDKIFSAGADLSGGFGDYGPVDFLKRGQDVWNKVEDFPKPVIAALNGHALGGGAELALACHFRFMKKSARIGQTETNLGIIPGYGGTLRLPRLVGRSKALELMILGTQIEAGEALRIGLVDRVCDDATLMEEVFAFAEQLAVRPPLCVKALLKIASISASVSPEQHLKIEREELGRLFATKDMIEGMTAFAQKRAPEFKGE